MTKETKTNIDKLISIPVSRFEELEKDKERLDWMIENEAQLEKIKDNAYWVLLFTDDDIVYSNPSKTARDAIDAVMEQTDE